MTIKREAALKLAAAVIVAGFIAGSPALLAAAEGGIVPQACRLGDPGPCTICHLAVLVINFTNFLMKIIAFPAAALLVAIGGLTLLISGASENLRTLGKTILTNTVIGLIIVMIAWLLVDTAIKTLVGESSSNFFGTFGPWHEVRPERCPVAGESLVSSFSVPPPPAASPPPAAAPLPTPGVSATTNIILARLQSAGIEVRSTGRSPSGGNCYDINNPTCTNLDGLPPRTFDNLENIKAVCRSPVALTAGAETGHRAHGPGIATVDLAYNQTTASCIRNRVPQFNIRRICTRPQDSAYRYNCNANEDKPHLHVEFN